MDTLMGAGVGDTVIFNSGADGYFGDIAKVLEVDLNDLSIKCEFLDGSVLWMWTKDVGWEVIRKAPPTPSVPITDSMLQEVLEELEEPEEEDKWVSLADIIAAEDEYRKPSHYDFAQDPADFCIHNELNGPTTNVIKYVCRGGRKLYPGKNATESRIEDLKKAQEWIRKELVYLQGQLTYDNF